MVFSKSYGKEYDVCSDTISPPQAGTLCNGKGYTNISCVE